MCGTRCRWKCRSKSSSKKLKFYVIDAISIAEELGLGARINVIMQTAFFKISRVIELDTAIGSIKGAIKKTYGSKGDKVVKMNNAAVDAALDKIYEVKVPAQGHQQNAYRLSGPGRCPTVC